MRHEDFNLTPDLRNWGEAIPVGLRYATDHSCNCGEFGIKHLERGAGQKIVENAVGFEYKPTSEKAGKVMIQCPHCSDRFWFHIPQTIAKMLLRDKSHLQS